MCKNYHQTLPILPPIIHLILPPIIHLILPPIIHLIFQLAALVKTKNFYPGDIILTEGGLGEELMGVRFW